MILKIIHLEDNISKHMSITRVIQNSFPAKIELATDMGTGLEMIEKAITEGTPYDLAITDMHYPLSKGVEANWEAGEFFIDVLENKEIKLPVIVCSTMNMKIPKAYGCVWYSDISNWELELRDIVNKMLKERKAL